MAIRQIVKLGDEVLRKKSFAVTDFGERTHELLGDMYDTLKKANGAGLAAVQVGVLRRIFLVIKGESIEDGVYEMLNPEIIKESGEQYGTEGCLSVPGKWGEVKRPYKVTVKYQDRYGKPKTLKAEGFLAKAICHEYDHLNGVVYVDKADNLRAEEK
ncbi:MAG: peptide deformylase [Clostridia bacterium]|nr:peptide deformylase [Clostridia bacterium]